MQFALTAPILWQSARAMLAELFFLVGTATAAALTRLKPADRRRALAWLDALETMVRKLLLIEAAALAPKLERGPSGPHRTSTRAAMLSQSSAVEQNASLKARAPTFRLLPPESRAKPHPARIRMLGSATSVQEIWRDQQRATRIANLRSSTSPQPGARFANRIAALAAVIENPIPHVRRLARLMRDKTETALAIAAARLASIPPTFHLDAYRSAESEAYRVVSYGKCDSS